jgi:uncharacterized ferritin-like protein (DUF455 family)
MKNAHSATDVPGNGVANGATRDPVCSVADFARRVLEEGSLAAKLLSPRDSAGKILDDSVRPPARFVDAPARIPSLALVEGRERLPKMGELARPDARAATIARFAHHELMAVELFAWALLAFPDADRALRRAWLVALEEEQRHLSLYLDRLAAHGSTLSEHRLNGYFWKVLPVRATDGATPLVFLSAMGLTLEQANLDFTRVYEAAFRAVDDHATADVVRVVHDDEIGHVALAQRFARKIDVIARSDVERYRATVPFPLSAARAKGKQFCADARRRAGLSDEMIAHVRTARPYDEERT